MLSLSLPKWCSLVCDLHVLLCAQELSLVRLTAWCWADDEDGLQMFSPGCCGRLRGAGLLVSLCN